jgi:plastocyanin
MTCFRTGTRPLENKKEVQKMKSWYLPLVIAIVALLMPVSTANVNAQGELSISKSADPTSAAVGDNITYTYTIVNNTDNITDNITLVDDKLGTIIDQDKQTSLGASENITVTATYTVKEDDLPGPLVNIATVSGTDPDGNTITDNVSASVKLIYTASIQVTKTANPTSASPGENITYTYTITNTGNVTVDNITLTDDKLGTITLSTTNLAPGENVTATATYTTTISDLPGPIINTATVTGTDPTGESISLTSDPVSVSLYINKRLLTKAEILKLSGVPGKGIEKAPGLQKLFNPKSQAAEHAGKKDKDKEEEQLQIRQMTENHGAAKGQLKIRRRVENQP